MRPTFITQVLAAVVMVLSGLGVGSWAFAEEGTVKVVTPWKGRSFEFPVGPDQGYIMAIYSGVLFVDDEKGPFHGASIVCPATGESDLKTMRKTGQGRCVITDEDGNHIYASFTCSGDPEGCRGPFTIGGTGKFAGITGQGEMISRVHVRQVATASGFYSGELALDGVATWPSLAYKIPSSAK